MAAARSTAVFCLRAISPRSAAPVPWRCPVLSSLASLHHSHFAVPHHSLSSWPGGGKYKHLLSGKTVLRQYKAPVGLRQYSVGTSSEDTKSSKPLGLADQIMASKVSDQKDSSEKSDSGEGKEKEGPKAMPKWQKYSYLFMGFMMGGSLVANAVIFSLPDRDEQGNDIEDEFSHLPCPSQNYRRLKNKIFTTKKAIEEPFSDKLLPDPLPEGYYQPKYTVILELTGLLVHATWTHKYGWRFQKRPGLDMFLAQVGYPNFELVIWTVENAMTFYPIINQMDPEQRYIFGRLFKDATHYTSGMHIKDLDHINRDLKNVIVVDWNKDTTLKHDRNALTLKKWTGDNSDRTLIGLAQLLHAIKDSDTNDVRDVMEYYQQFEDPIEAFRENQRKLEEAMQLEEERKRKEKESGSKLSSFSGLSSFRGFRRS